MQDLSGYGTKELNLEGKIVVPGFIDSHVHLIFSGLQVLRNSIYCNDFRRLYFLFQFSSPMGLILCSLEVILNYFVKFLF